VLWRFALRNLQGGLSGFRVFIACIALGVAAIAGVSSLSNALTDGLGKQAKTILGGDLSFSRIHREATPEERAKFASLGQVSFGITTRAMARLPGDGQAALVELKAVDAQWPLTGKPELSPELPLKDLFADANGIVVLPRRMVPASRKRATTGESSVSILSGETAEPRRQGTPLTTRLSLIVIGTPSSGESGSPICQRDSECFASAKASSVNLTMKALICGSKLSRRAM